MMHGRAEINRQRKAIQREVHQALACLSVYINLQILHFHVKPHLRCGLLLHCNAIETNCDFQMDC